MKVIIAGSRVCKDPVVVAQAIADSRFEITEVVSGCAAGVDTYGEKLAEQLGIPVKRFPAEWKRYGKAAGVIRNGWMADYAEALIAVVYNGSRGTLNMIEQARKRGLKVYVKEVNDAMLHE